MFCSYAWNWKSEAVTAVLVRIIMIYVNYIDYNHNYDLEDVPPVEFMYLVCKLHTCQVRVTVGN